MQCNKEIYRLRLLLGSAKTWCPGCVNYTIPALSGSCLTSTLTSDEVSIVVAGPLAEDAVELLPDVPPVPQLVVRVEVLRRALDLAPDVRHSLFH